MTERGLPHWSGQDVKKSLCPLLYIIYYWQSYLRTVFFIESLSYLAKGDGLISKN